MTIKVSTLIATYNYANYLGRALQSALNQTFDQAQHEILVVDDGSTDDTQLVLKEFKGRIVNVCQQNLGLPEACNRGILEARGEYLIRLDSDDEMHPNLIESCFDILDSNPTVGLVYTDRIDIDVIKNIRKIHRVDPDNIFDIIAPGVMFRRQNLIDVGMYKNFYWEEHDLMMRYLKTYKPHHLQKPLYMYYLHGGNMTASNERRHEGWMELMEYWGIEKLRCSGQSDEMEIVAQRFHDESKDNRH